MSPRSGAAGRCRAVTKTCALALAIAVPLPVMVASAAAVTGGESPAFHGAAETAKIVKKKKKKTTKLKRHPRVREGMRAPGDGEMLVNPSFETGMAGWRANGAAMRRLGFGDAPDGRYGVRIESPTALGFGISTTADPVPSATAGERFVATARVRAARTASAGESVALILRERKNGTLLAEKSTSVTLTGRFSSVAVAHTAIATGSQIDLRLSYRGRAYHGRGVDADDFHLGSPQPPAAPGNRPPDASFTVSPASPVAGQVVTLTSTSSDPDGRVVALAWDVDGDGAYDDGAGGTARVTFPSAGSRTVGLRATDDGGASVVARTPVAVVAPPIAAPPPSTTMPPPPARGSLFDGSVDALADGSVASGGATFGPWRQVNLTSGARITVDDGDDAPLRFAGRKTLRYEVGSSAGRGEMSSVKESSTEGQRDPATTQGNGTTQYIAFSFYFRSPPQTGGWGWLPVQGKSLVSNTNPAGLSPQLSLINEGGGSNLLLRTIGGEAGSHTARKAQALGSITPGAWYDVILAARAEVTETGWAKAWIVPQGGAMLESSPSAQILDAKTNYSWNGAIEPIIWRQGLYHSPAASGRDLDAVMTPMARYGTFSDAMAYFAR